MATKESMDDDADYWYEDDEDEDDGEPDYYECFCCGHSITKNPGGWGCPKCGAKMEEGYF